MRKIFVPFENPVTNEKEELFIGTAKRVEEFIMVETKDYTRLYSPEEFSKFLKESNYNVV